jgi:hypothetical protein
MGRIYVSRSRKKKLTEPEESITEQPVSAESTPSAPRAEIITAPQAPVAQVEHAKEAPEVTEITKQVMVKHEDVSGLHVEPEDHSEPDKPNDPAQQHETLDQIDVLQQELDSRDIHEMSDEPVEKKLSEPNERPEQSAVVLTETATVAEEITEEAHYEDSEVTDFVEITEVMIGPIMTDEAPIENAPIVYELSYEEVKSEFLAELSKGFSDEIAAKPESPLLGTEIDESEIAEDTPPPIMQNYLKILVETAITENLQDFKKLPEQDQPQVLLEEVLQITSVLAELKLEVPTETNEQMIEACEERLYVVVERLLIQIGVEVDESTIRILIARLISESSITTEDPQAIDLSSSGTHEAKKLRPDDVSSDIRNLLGLMVGKLALSKSYAPAA